MARIALQTASVHRNLRAARYTQRHGEGETSDQVQIRQGDRIMQIDYDDFMALANALRDSGVGPIMARDEIDF